MSRIDPVARFSSNGNPVRCTICLLWAARAIPDGFDQYVQLACSLATDPERRRRLRATMRLRMSTSPLMNAGKFTSDVEAAFDQMWLANTSRGSDR